MRVIPLTFQGRKAKEGLTKSDLINTLCGSRLLPRHSKSLWARASAPEAITIQVCHSEAGLRPKNLSSVLLSQAGATPLRQV
jgi:hypothetical protein